MNSKQSRLMALAGAVALGGALQANATVFNVNADITAPTTWTTGNEYVLQQPIFVRDGGELWIQPGVIVRGVTGTLTPFVAPGALIVARGNKIHAQGTRTQPIVMTDMVDDHFVGPTPTAGTAPYNQANNGLTAQWGGLLLLGECFLASDSGEPGTTSPNAALQLQIEGTLPYGTYGMYGGGNDNSDSGELSYISIRYGGFVLGSANEINGLTMGGVGRLTDIEHIEVYQTKDDGFEWFGGTVHTKFLVNWANGDDAFDSDEGYRGKGQFWLAVQGPIGTIDVSDKAFEWDGCYQVSELARNDDSQPSSVGTLFNATLVGTGNGVNKKNTAMHFRDGSGGRVYNSAVMDFGGAPALIEGSVGGLLESADQCTASYVQDAYYTHSAVANAQNKKLEINHCLFWNMGTNAAPSLPTGSGKADDWGASSMDESVAHFGYPLFTSSALQNVYRTIGTPPVATLTRSAVGQVVSGKTYYPVTKLNPTPVVPQMLIGGFTPPADGFFAPVKYVGAFNQINWASWTLVSRLGLLETAYNDIGSPIADAQVNGSDAPAPIAAGSSITFTGKMMEEFYAASTVGEYWLVVQGAGLTYWYNHSHIGVPTGWRTGAPARYMHWGQIQDVANFSKSAVLATPGTYTFTWGWDSIANDAMDPAAGYFDSVTFTVQ